MLIRFNDLEIISDLLRTIWWCDGSDSESRLKCSEE